MSHDYHETLPGYHPAQILHDGCGECEARSNNSDHGIYALDSMRFVRAWLRAAEWNHAGLPDLSRAEIPLLSMLWGIQIQLERLGVPIGELPQSDPISGGAS